MRPDRKAAMRPFPSAALGLAVLLRAPAAVGQYPPTAPVQAAAPSPIKLSGEAQRTSLARAFVVAPEVLFLDEAFAALDAPTREGLLLDVETILRESNVTAVFATHERAEALMLADRVVPVNGQVVIQPVITLSLSCDHRAVDGARGAQFLDTLVHLIEHPLSLLD